MCLLVFAWRAHPRYPLIFAGNRDEFHARAATAMDWWETPPGLLAGKDLSAGGTWLGMTRGGRFGVVTNYREMTEPRIGAPSRGRLIPELADETVPVDRYAARIDANGSKLAGYNLLFGAPLDGAMMVHSNRNGPPAPVTPGLHGLSNHLLDTPWPKLTRTLRRFETAMTGRDPDPEALFGALADRLPADDDELPKTGIGYDWEKRLSSPFIVSERYGTRCSTVVTVDHHGNVVAIERRFGADGEATGESRFEFNTVRQPLEKPARG